jgi:hypothetical protein
VGQQASTARTTRVHADRWRPHPNLQTLRLEDRRSRDGVRSGQPVFLDTLLTDLQRGQQVFLGLGLVPVVAGWFAGSNKYGA